MPRSCEELTSVVAGCVDCSGHKHELDYLGYVRLLNVIGSASRNGLVSGAFPCRSAYPPLAGEQLKSKGSPNHFVSFQS
jgi:hypothetical protein